MNKKLKLVLITVLITVTMTLTGCWDRVELENRAFVMVTGIDKYDPKKSKTSEKSKAVQNEDNKLKMTYILPKFTAIKQGEEGEASRQILTGVGKTPYDVTRQLTVRSDSKPFFQHMKATVLGLDIIKDRDAFLEILDGLERQDEISRKLHIFVAEDQASDVLQVKSILKPLSYKLQGMSVEGTGTNLFIPKTLEEIISSTIQGATLIPRVTASETEIKVAGSAVLKESQFIGWLGAEDTKSVAFITGAVKQDIVQIEHEGTTIPYIIKEVKTRRNAKVEDGKIKIDILLTIRGDIQQYKIEQYPRLTNEKLIGQLEQTLNKTIKKQLDRTVYKLQNDLEADVIDVGDYLKGHKTDIWKEVEDEWNEIFPKVDVNIKVDAFVDKIGSVK